MINLGISAGIGLALFLLGWAVGGSFIAGFAPAALGFVAAYFLLARRTGRQLEALMKEAMVHFEKGDTVAGRKVLDRGFVLGRWQLLVTGQIHAQLGSLDYMQQHYKEARAHLEKAQPPRWLPLPNWSAIAMLAAVEHREGNHEEAVKRIVGGETAGAKDPVYWALRAWICHEAGNKDEALKATSAGLAKVGSSPGLKQIDEILRNGKRLREKTFQAFAPTWYQFFPEHMSREQMMQLYQQQQAARGEKVANVPTGYQFPQPRPGRPR